MRILDKSPFPYVPSWAQKPHHLHKRMKAYRQKVEEERKAAENNQQQQQRPENWR